MMFEFTQSKITFLVGLTLFCLAFQPTVFASSSKDVALDSPFTLKIEDTAKIDSELRLTVLDAVEDSRCPSDVTCVWEGAVSVQVNLIRDDLDLGNHTILLGESEDDKQIFAGYFIKLITVEPYPSSTVPIKSSDYVLTFLVSKINEMKIDAPLKQFNTGISINNIHCKADLVLVIKSSNFSPACVTPNTAEKLSLRGWADENTLYVNPIIKTGTYAGHCIGYCAKEFLITPDKIIFSQNGRDFVSDEWSDLPEKTKEFTLSQAEWSGLVDLINFDQFRSLPDKIGCPGCADAPVEWIEISYDDKTKRIEFENGDEIPELSELIVVLREIQNRAEPIASFEECVLAGNSVMESYPRQCRTTDGKNFVEEIDDVLETPHEIEGKRSPVNVPDAISENDMWCQTSWNIETTEVLDTVYVKNSVQSTIAQFGETYFLEERIIDVFENSVGYTVSISGLWDHDSIQYQMIAEDLGKFGTIQGEPASCQ
ncbi:hypothetical protein NZNM25_05030 [Nitrosopumilus zosterae]|uniref:Uncharacterized protein n=1 Tax=Nitrosopumilus zosterae TaxID=718286 RepID=A0A2S2KPW4_9ARCH|nr:hypothetical protein [Nitrosopumilus zosterae]BDQ31507.1 hypothetical protein NZOSNM25_001627 [Nitrosopumilus zosterae]GBH33712.1 hypothetical protein NZNM25_05030 [Nitrosopumilus zosterae]